MFKKLKIHKNRSFCNNFQKKYFIFSSIIELKRNKEYKEDMRLRNIKPALQNRD